MPRKLFSFLRAVVEAGECRLTFYKSTPLFTADKSDSMRIRIYRRHEADYRFNDDYAEYFDGLTPTAADVVFDGDLPAQDHRKFTYRDTTVEIGQTYAYWVSSGEDAPVGPTAVRVRDPRVWWSAEEITARMSAIATQYPTLASPVTFGHTRRGRQLEGLRVGNPDNCIALIGAVHPGESGPELIIGALEQLMAENPEALHRTGLVILPSVGIDQRQQIVRGNPWYLRVNYSGVDINRNFPSRWDTVEHTYGLSTNDPDAATYRGPEPASEPETQAVMAMVSSTKPRCVLSFHCLASIAGPNFFTTKYGAQDAAFEAQCRAWIEPYTRGFYPEQADPPIMLHYACDAGSLSTWLYHEFGIPGFDLEWDGRDESRISHNDLTTPELVAEYQRRHYHGLLAALSTH